MPRMLLSCYSKLSWDNLYFKHDAGDGTLHDVGSVEAVNAISAKYAALFTDCATSVNPEQTSNQLVHESAKYQQTGLWTEDQQTRYIYTHRIAQLTSNTLVLGPKYWLQDVNS